MVERLWTVGFHAVRALVDSDRPIDALWLQGGRRDARVREIERAARRRGIRYEVVPRVRLDRIAGGVAHNGCAARSAPIAFTPLPEIIAAPEMPSRILLLDDLTDPHNVGAAIRTATAFALDGIVLAGPAAPPLGGAVAKAAVGLLGRVPIVRESVAADAIKLLQDEGYWILGADAEGGDLGTIDVPSRWVLCLGAEGRGLRAKTRSRIDERVAIPMAPGVESLNTSVAAGILLWELSRSSS